MTHVFISYSTADAEIVGGLRTAFASQSWETSSRSGVSRSETLEDPGSGGDIAAADAVIVLLPGGESSWVRREVGEAQALGKPVLLVETPVSAAPGIGLWDQPTIRWNLKDTAPILRAVNMMLRTSPTADARSTTPTTTPALSPDQARQWDKSIRRAEVDLYERQVTMMLLESGLDLSPPEEVGVDLVAWSDDTSHLLGNPFGIEIKRVLTPAGEEQARSWLARSGVSSLLILVGENHDVAVTSTDFGRLMLVLPVTDLVDELARTGFGDAVRALALRAGVHL